MDHCLIYTRYDYSLCISLKHMSKCSYVKVFLSKRVSHASKFQVILKPSTWQKSNLKNHIIPESDSFVIERNHSKMSILISRMLGMYKFRYAADKSVQDKVNNWKMLNLAQLTRNETKVHKISYVDKP